MNYDFILFVIHLLTHSELSPSLEYKTDLFIKITR